MFVEWLKKEFEESGLTQTEFAKKANIGSCSTLNRWMRRERSPNWASFYRVVDALEVSEKERLGLRVALEDARAKRKAREYYKEVYGKNQISKESGFYELENELIKEYGRLGNVPENNEKLKKIRGLVGVE